MKYSEEFREKIAEKCHEDLLAIGRRAERIANMPMSLGNGANPENAAFNAILKKDPYAHLREKTEMRRDENGELAVQTK